MGIEQMSEHILELGAIGIALMVAWRALGLVSFKWMGRQIKNGSVPMMTPLACQTDPEHFLRIKKMDGKMDVVHKYVINNEPAMRKVRNGVGSSMFSCIWKDRDEVVNHVSAIKELTIAVNTLTREIKRQNGK